jgi:hypothetical protein
VSHYASEVDRRVQLKTRNGLAAKLDGLLYELPDDAEAIAGTGEKQSAGALTACEKTQVVYGLFVFCETERRGKTSY